MGVDIQKLTMEVLFEDNGIDTSDYFLICSIITEEFYDKDGEVVNFPYDMLAEYVYTSEEILNEENEILLKNIECLRKICSAKDKKIIESFCNKFMKHYKLSKVQKEFMMSISKEANKLSKNAEESAIKAQGIIDNNQKIAEGIEKQLESVKETKGVIYTEFIAILGIFSALIFGLFGGFQGLSEAIVKLSTDWSVGRVLIIGSGIMMCLTLLIFGLLQWVARLTGRKLTSCDCYENKEKCQHSLFRRHRTLFSLVLSFIFIFVLGEYIETFETYSNISETWIFIPLAWSIPVILILIVLIVIWNVFDLKKWKPKWKSKKNK